MWYKFMLAICHKHDSKYLFCHMDGPIIKDKVSVLHSEKLYDMLVNSCLINLTITEAIITFFCQGLCYKEVC